VSSSETSKNPSFQIFAKSHNSFYTNTITLRHESCYLSHEMKTILIMLSVLGFTLSAQAGAEPLAAAGEPAGTNGVVAGTNIASQAVATNATAWQYSSPAPRLAPPVKPELSIWRSLGSLLIVLGGLFAVTWYLKKRVAQTAGSTGGKRMEIIQRLSLGNHQYAALLRVDGKDIILGISPTQITHLGLTTIAPSATADAPASFSNILASVTGKMTTPTKNNPGKP
jgi:flagellar biogenesis protein FliO